VTGPDLLRRRLALGLTQEALARRLDVTVGTLYRWEKGTLGIRHPTHLAAALDALDAAARREWGE
jgi:transcriptional regulator with XRE-family HTH domain